MKKTEIGAIFLIALLLLIASIGMAYADRGVPSLPEIQGLVTNTGMNIQGTITETDAGAWSMNSGGIPLSGDDPILANYPNWAIFPILGGYQAFLNDWHALQGYYPGISLQDALNRESTANPITWGPWVTDFTKWVQSQGSPLTPPLEDNEVQYSTGYNDQTMAVSGQSSFVKSVSVSTANTIADQSNIKADNPLSRMKIFYDEIAF